MELLKACPGLGEFDISNARLLARTSSVQSIAQAQKDKLKKMVVHGTQVGNAAVKAVVTNCPSIRVLDVSLTSVGKLGIEELQRSCPRLRELDLAGCILECQKVRATDQGPGFPDLEILSVAGAAFRSGLDSWWGRLLRNSPNLRVVDLRRTSFPTQADLASLPYLQKLRVLLAGSCQGLTQDLFGTFSSSFFCFL